MLIQPRAMEFSGLVGPPILCFDLFSSSIQNAISREAWFVAGQTRDYFLYSQPGSWIPRRPLVVNILEPRQNERSPRKYGLGLRTLHVQFSKTFPSTFPDVSFPTITPIGRPSLHPHHKLVRNADCRVITAVHIYYETHLIP
jgi:hypothetical protein